MRGRRHGGKWFVVCVVPNDLSHDRLGLIVGKRLTRTSVARNSIKRMIRESFRTRVAGAVGTGRDIVVQLRAPPGNSRLGREELASLLAKAADLIPPK
ncbi:MAG: ribonuclease P protein component [Burkholderiales bacterium]|nr:ribonuclease P protein component [Burkholderiales bacterium]